MAYDIKLFIFLQSATCSSSQTSRFKSAYSRTFYDKAAHILQDIDAILQLIYLGKEMGFTQR